MTCSKTIDQFHNNNSIASLAIEKCYFIFLFLTIISIRLPTVKLKFIKVFSLK